MAQIATAPAKNSTIKSSDPCMRGAKEIAKAMTVPTHRANHSCHCKCGSWRNI